MGAKQGWIGAADKLWERPPDICIASGFAGGLTTAHKSGDIVVARSVREKGSLEESVCDAELVSLAADCGAKPVDRFYTADRVISTSAEKRILGATAQAVDMESAAVLRQAKDWGCRCVAIRAISDAVDEDLPLDFNLVTTPSGQIGSGRLIGEIARHPLAVPALIRFGLQAGRIAQELGSFLERYVARIEKHRFAPLQSTAETA
jgi:adenosylhomocysteine nucleosidase